MLNTLLNDVFNKFITTLSQRLAVSTVCVKYGITDKRKFTIHHKIEKNKIAKEHKDLLTICKNVSMTILKKEIESAEIEGFVETI